MALLEERDYKPITVLAGQVAEKRDVDDSHPLTLADSAVKVHPAVGVLGPCVAWGKPL
jgi:hypothetical protein